MLRNLVQAQTQHVRGDLFPQAAARAAVGDHGAARTVTPLGHDLEMVHEAVGNALEDGAVHVGARVTQCQAEEDAPGQRVVDGRFLPQEVGQQNETIGSRGNLLRLGIEVRVVEVGREGVAEPLDDRAAGGHAAVEQVLAGHHVIVDEQTRIGVQLVQHVEDVPRAAEFHQQIPLLAQARGKGGGHVVGGASHHGGARAQARVRGRLGRHMADDVAGAVHLAQPRAVDAGQGEDVVGPVVLVHVEQAALQGPVLLAGEHTREAVVDEVVGAEHLARAGHHLGFVAPEPEQLGADALLGDRATRAVKNVGLVGLGLELLDLHVGASVILLDAGAQHVARLVQQHDGRHHAADAHGRDVLGGEAARPQVATHRAHILPPLVGVLLRPAGQGGHERAGRGGFGKNVSFCVDNHGLGGRSANVDAQEVGHGCLLVGGSGIRYRVLSIGPRYLIPDTRYPTSYNPPRISLTTSMNALTRSGSTGFQV